MSIFTLSLKQSGVLCCLPRFVKQFGNENSVEESLFEQLDQRAGIRHSSFSLPCQARCAELHNQLAKQMSKRCDQH